MTNTLRFAITISLLTMALGAGNRLAYGQQAAEPQPAEPWRASPGAGAAAATDQPAGPQYPQLERRPVQQEPQVPFVLAPAEQARLDQTLNAWEQRNREIKTFDCAVSVLTFDSVFSKGGKPLYADQGVLRYAAPDKGLFRIDGDRPQQWICDGKAVYEYKYDSKQVVEYPLPPELQGKSIANGPIPFVFGNEAQRLKQRYFLRLTTPPNVEDQVWIEAFPRYQHDAAEFRRVELILKGAGMTPFAVQIDEPSGKTRKVFQFDKVVINSRWRLLEGDPFRVSVPYGWKRYRNQILPVQASRALPAAH
ncbi:MAG: TIGR03009 domain-containing protein [Thermoguttaceae bacterium]|jgi:TIGR03009 family protein